MASDFDRDPDRARRIRAALYGRGRLSRQDAEYLKRQRSSALGWFGRRSKGRTVALAVLGLLGVAQALGRAAEDGVVAATGPIILVVAYALAMALGWRRNRVIERALRDSSPH